MPKNNSDIGVVIVVYIPFGWDDQPIWHRRKSTEALATALLGQGVVLVVEPYICPTTGWYRRNEREKLSRALCEGRLHRKSDNLYVFTPFVWLPVRWQHVGWIRKFNNWILARQIRKTVRHILPDVKAIVSWFYHPEHVDFVGLANEDYVTYECYDQYHTAYGTKFILGPGRAQLIQRQEQELLCKADIVFTTSEKLREEKSKTHSNVYLFPNAADSVFFAKVQVAETIIAEEVKTFQRPIIGYLGEINRHLDIDLLLYVVVTKPDWTFLMAGRAHDEGMAQSEAYHRLIRLPNVHLVGWIREEIPNYFKAVDVCLIPFRTDSKFNQYRNPYKLHEYTAMGKPVVSADIPCVRSHADIIYIAHTKEEFVACIERALADDSPDKIAKRLRVAWENTWEKRAERMVEVVRRGAESNL